MTKRYKFKNDNCPRPAGEHEPKRKHEWSGKGRWVGVTVCTKPQPAADAYKMQAQQHKTKQRPTPGIGKAHPLLHPHGSCLASPPLNTGDRGSRGVRQRGRAMACCLWCMGYQLNSTHSNLNLPDRLN